MIKSILILIGYYLATVIIADIAGVLVNSLFDIFGGRGKSQLLYYTVWFVVAVFAGLYYYSFSEDHIKKSKAFGGNYIIIIFIAILLSILAIFIFYTFGQMKETSMYYVPGNPYMTYTFFIMFILATFIGKASVGKKATNIKK